MLLIWPFCCHSLNGHWLRSMLESWLSQLSYLFMNHDYRWMLLLLQRQMMKLFDFIFRSVLKISTFSVKMSRNTSLVFMNQYKETSVTVSTVCLIPSEMRLLPLQLSRRPSVSRARASPPFTTSSNWSDGSIGSTANGSAAGAPGAAAAAGAANQTTLFSKR